MFKKILSIPRTSALTRELSASYTLPRPEEVVRCLEGGANAWALATGGKSVLELLLSRCPYPEAVEAWMNAAGNLKLAPWEKHGSPSPLLLAMTCLSQPDQFRYGVIRKLLDRECSLRGLEGPVSWAPARSFVEVILTQFDSPLSERLLDQLIDRDPTLLRTPLTSVFLDGNRHPGLLRRRVELETVELQSATPAAQGIRRRPRF